MERTGKVEDRRNIVIKSLVERREPGMPSEVVCRLLDRRSGREYLVVDNGPGRALADYVGEDVEALGTVQEREGDWLISIRDFRPYGDPDLDLDEYSQDRNRSGRRWGSFQQDLSGRDKNRSQTKAIQSARRLKKDRQNWEGRAPRTKE